MLDTVIGLISQTTPVIVKCHPQSSCPDHLHIVSSVSDSQCLGG